MPVWVGQLFIVGLIAGTIWALRAFSEDHSMVWVGAIIVGWGVGLPLVNTLVLRSFRGGQDWPWGDDSSPRG